MKDVMISVFMLTYNQEQFIAQAIRGVLMQKSSYSIQLVIGEDCSTDGTRRICEKFAEENATIKLLPSENHLGLIQNFVRTYRECDGKYVAICDGDDYWTDPKKLQKQVEFLEQNLDYNLIFTSFRFLFPNGQFVERDYQEQAETTNFKNLIFGNYISSVTAVFRNKKNVQDFPYWLENCPYGDWPLYLWSTRDGSKIKFIKEITAVYRSEIGVSERMKSVPSRIALENYRIIRRVKKDRHFIQFPNHIQRSLHLHYRNLLSCYIREGRVLEVSKVTINLLINQPCKTLGLYAYHTKRKFYSMFTISSRYAIRKFSHCFYQNGWFNKIIFSRIYKNNSFNRVRLSDRSESRSGPGSSIEQTREVIKRLPELLLKYRVQSILDIPCGDFFWMQRVNLPDITYIGGDIVPDIIAHNKTYTSKNIKFKKIDILNDPLPRVDLIFCRDLFVHLTFNQIFKALENIRASGSKYLLTTTYKSRILNRDIKEIGSWRALNLQIHPFYMHKYIDQIWENCTEGNNSNNDKYLVLFKISDIDLRNQGLGGSSPFFNSERQFS